MSIILNLFHKLFSNKYKADNFTNIKYSKIIDYVYRLSGSSSISEGKAEVGLHEGWMSKGELLAMGSRW